MITLTSYATEDFIPSQVAQAESALHHGARRIAMWRPGDLRATAFYARHRDILDRPRGGGYWLWKPYIILVELEKLQQGDVLIYSDCGKPDNPHTVSRPLTVLTDWCRDQRGGMLPGVYIPQYGRNAIWTKGECFTVMGCEADSYRNHPQIQATFSVWEKHDRSMEFVREWLNWCTVPAALLDDHIDPSIPDAPDFRQHRHDQSILTLLALKHGLKCFGSPVEARHRSKKIDRLIDRIAGDKAVNSYAAKFPSLSLMNSAERTSPEPDPKDHQQASGQ